MIEQSVIRYFRVPVADYAAGTHQFLLASHLNLFDNAAKIAEIDSQAILKVVISPATADYIYEATGIENPLTLEAVQQLSLETYYLGETLDDVFAVYPDLDGQEQVGTDPDTGEPIMRDKCRRVVWHGIG